MENPLIRFVQKSDMKSLIKLCSLHAEFEKCAYDQENKAESLKKHLFSDQPSIFCLVAEQSDRLIGYATYMKQFSTWDAESYLYMDCLFLTSASRGLGIGEQLVNRIKQEGAKLGCSTVQWQTPDFNERAMKFYYRIGASSKSKERFFLDL